MLYEDDELRVSSAGLLFDIYNVRHTYMQL